MRCVPVHLSVQRDTTQHPALDTTPRHPLLRAHPEPKPSVGWECAGCARTGAPAASSPRSANFRAHPEPRLPPAAGPGGREGGAARGAEGLKEGDGAALTRWPNGPGAPRAELTAPGGRPAQPGAPPAAAAVAEPPGGRSEGGEGSREGRGVDPAPPQPPPQPRGPHGAQPAPGGDSERPQPAPARPPLPAA